MKLPPELRILVYEFALRDITDPIMFPASGEVEEPQRHRGAPALHQTSKHLLSECWPAMMKIADRYFWTLHDAFKVASERFNQVIKSKDLDSPAFWEAKDNCRRAPRRVKCIGIITTALSGASWADFSHRRAHLEKTMAADGLSQATERAQ